jgi:Tol biopolymer transport system component
METVGNETALPGSPENHPARAELDRVLASAQFQSSARHRRFLEFVVERTLAGEADRLKEYRIALEVFGRSVSFDPQRDPIVRVEARRLRAKLASFYQSQGLQNGLRIAIPKGGYAAVFETGDDAQAPTDDDSDPVLPSAEDSAKVLLGPARPPQVKLLATILACILVAVGCYALYSLLRHKRRPFSAISVKKVTRSGRAICAAISPDGKYILNALSDGGMESVWLRNISSGDDVEVIPPEQVYYRGLQFSRDGNYLYFVRIEEGNWGLGYLYRVPVLGGQPQKLITDIDTDISFSPDGKKFTFVAFDNHEGKYRLVIASLDGVSQKDLATGPLTAPVSDPAWSPDGKTIVCTVRQTGNALSGLLAIDVAKGKQELFFKSGTARLSRPVWLPDGTGLLVLSSDQSSNFTEQEITLVSYPQGEPHPVTRDTNSYSGISVAADGHTLVTVLGEAHWNLFVTQPGSTSEASARQLTSDASVQSFSWTRDDKLIVSQDSGLSLIDPDSSSKFALTVPGHAIASQPSVCPDGRTVLAISESGEGGAQSIWRRDADGRNLTRLTTGKADRFPVCSGDGRSVYYEDFNQTRSFRSVPLDGGEPHPVGNWITGSCAGCVRSFDISPDGKFAIFSVFLGPDHKLLLLQLDSPSKSRLLDYRRSPEHPTVRFAPGDKALVYPVRSRGVDNLWVQRLDGSQWDPLTDFPAEEIRDFQFSPNGTRIALTRGHVDSNVILIRDADTTK